MVPCAETTFCRQRLCHSEKDKCYSSDNCCDCNHGHAFNGTACVPETDMCPCKDESGNVRKPGEKWTDAQSPCKEHVCINNMVDTKDVSRDCPPITCDLLVSFVNILITF